jgi:adenylate kinase
MKFDIVFFIGPQGSGKGTQAKLLAERLGLFYFEMGAIFREEAKQPTEFGKRIADLINAGSLVDDETVFSVFEDKMKQLPNTEGILFDGIPRSLPQAEFVIKYLKGLGRSTFATVFLDLSQEESVKRLLLRAHHEFRADDTKEAIVYRLQQYERATVPVLDFLKTVGSFYQIDGSPPVETVTAEIQKQLGL